MEKNKETACEVADKAKELAADITFSANQVQRHLRRNSEHWDVVFDMLIAQLKHATTLIEDPKDVTEEV